MFNIGVRCRDRACLLTTIAYVHQHGALHPTLLAVHQK